MDLLEVIRAYAVLGSGIQSAIAKKKLHNAKRVKCVSIYDVLTKTEIARIAQAMKPKECYKNAYKVCAMMPDRAKYVEGVMGCIIPIDHAFVMIEGKYIDPTVELALGEDVTNNEYLSFYEVHMDKVYQVCAKSGVYGNVCDFDYIYEMKGQDNG